MSGSGVIRPRAQPDSLLPAIQMTKASSDRRPTDHDRLIDAWIKYHAEGMSRGGQVKDDDQNYWAAKMVDDLLRVDPETGWEVIEHIVARVEDPAVLAYIGAGPLEDLLAKHGRDFIDRVVAKIQSDPKFAEVAGSVWQNVIPPDVWITLQKALGQTPPELGF